MDKGAPWGQDYNNRLDPEFPFPSNLAVLLPHGDVMNVLDVGAGPLTILGTKCANKSIRLSAVDPLAEAYDSLLEEFNVQPLTRTVKCEAESLSSLFPPNSFDLVYARNSLDHSHTPFLAVCECLRVAKPGCFVYLEHNDNEGSHEDYQGLHQHNFTCDDEGNFFIWSPRYPRYSRNVTESLIGKAEVKCWVNDGWCFVEMRKLGSHAAV